MRIDVRDERRRRIGSIEVDPALRPTRVKVVESDRELFLNWDTALDDAGHVRRCVVCGCPDLFREKAFPQVTAFVVVLAFAGAVVSAFGYATTLPMLIVLGVVLVLDIGILIFSRRRLVCYRCASSYHGLSIARYHHRWDRATAERYPRPEGENGNGGKDESSGSAERSAANASAAAAQRRRSTGPISGRIA